MQSRPARMFSPRFASNPVFPGGQYTIPVDILVTCNWRQELDTKDSRNVVWPDFTRAQLYEALIDFQKRERRYGGLTETRRRVMV